MTTSAPAAINGSTSVECRVRVITQAERHLLVTSEQAATVLELDEAIGRLESEHARPARAVELHFFGGLTQEEAAEALGVSRSTVTRDLRFAVAWLRGRGGTRGSTRPLRAHPPAPR